MRANPNRASVIVVVLVTVGFAALLLARMLQSSAPDVLIAMRAADRDRLQADAYAALETTLAVLQVYREADGGLFAPAQGWGDPLTQGDFVPRSGVEVGVTFADESGKLSLPGMSQETLSKILEQSGLDRSAAGRVADAMFAWMHPGHRPAEMTTDARAYERADIPFTTPGRPLRSFAELAQIAVACDFLHDESGEPNRVQEEFRRQVSLYQFAATNVNAAPRDVLLAAGVDAALADRLKRAPGDKNQREYFRSAQAAGVTAGSFGAQIQALRINITVRKGAAQFRLSALVTWEGLASLPAPVPVPLAKTAVRAAASPEPAANEPERVRLEYPFTILELIDTALPVPEANHAPIT
ncbi:MAG: general secretion pathway protein GspK [Opitutaceae bacterium]|nr:general secretion pathway protein GspK [Opitutaceae bacterium]